ncbi:molybdenum cofactor guanylyltransferase [Desulfococcaceae bacterium HSG7]|nr:molybdenum cofactor guanylyltransferase [Desulfococcaceae bacterium HSG9]MDM8556905.1 molybdenum cofactor guanylyltransferase [Desulfococcaceae bacterium HSG7]
MKFEKCTGVILAGGLNTRFDGLPKALITVDGETILTRIYNVFEKLFDEIILVTNEPLLYLDWDVRIVSDLFPIRSSLTGIHTGLFYADRPYVFFAACDTPFLKKELVETVIHAMRPGFDVAMPATSAGFEPLCAVYSKQCIEAAARNIKRDKLKIQRVFRKSRILTISEKVLRDQDAHLDSFFNVNTPADLVRAETMLSGSGSKLSGENR